MDEMAGGGYRAMKLELRCCTSVLLNEIGGLALPQKDVALTYAMALCSSESTDWKSVNEAIIGRWSRSGLERIKRMAWKQIKARQ